MYKVQWQSEDMTHVGSIESFLDGQWSHYNRNTGDIYNADDVNSQKVNAFSHFVLAETGGQATVLDLQGTGYRT